MLVLQGLYSIVIVCYDEADEEGFLFRRRNRWNSGDALSGVEWERAQWS